MAVLLAFGSLALFAVFLGHIVSMLQPSSVITSIAADARPQLEHPFPADVGREPNGTRRHFTESTRAAEMGSVGAGEVVEVGG